MRMQTLIQCIYASISTPSFLESQIPQLLEHARTNNARLDISGMLLYIDEGFFQVLEGPAESVDTLYAKICSDRRHSRVAQIIREPIAERKFPDWSMGFSSVSLPEVGDLTGENDFFTTASCLQNLGSGRAKKLLNAFREGRWRADRTGRFAMRKATK